MVPAIEGVRLEGGPSAIEEFDLAGGRGGMGLNPLQLQFLKAYLKSPPGQLSMKEIREATGLSNNTAVINERAKLLGAGYLAPLEGKKGKYDLTPKGRKLFGQPADVAVGPAVSDDQISERVPQYQEVLKAIGEFRRKWKYAPVTKEVTAKINETAAEKVDDKMVLSAAAQMRKEELLTGETRGRHDLSDKGWRMFELAVGAGGAVQGVDGGGGAVLGGWRRHA